MHSHTVAGALILNQGERTDNSTSPKARKIARPCWKHKTVPEYGWKGSMNKYHRRRIGIKRARRVLQIFRARHPKDRYYYRVGGEYEHILIKTRVPCSCCMCGNPRRHLGKKTLQERKKEFDYE